MAFAPARAPRFEPQRWRARVCAVLFALGWPALATAADGPERQLLEAVQALQQGDSRAALEQLEQLVHREPRFRLAQLLYGEVLAARSGVAVADPLIDRNDPHVRALLQELHARLAAAGDQAPPPEALPDAILRLSARHRYAVVVDLPHARLYVLKNNGGTLARAGDYYVSLAKHGYGKRSAGDLRTPVGVYRVTGFKPGRELPAFYGAGAFPLNYPNGWDRLHGRDGDGIWLHGVPREVYARPPRASEGCVVLANDDLLALKPVLLADDTPVVLGDELQWRDAATLAQETEALERLIEDWRASLAARDARRYAAFYAEDFRDGRGLDKAGFVAAQRRFVDTRRRLKVRVRDLDLFRYPGERGLVLARFVEEVGSGRRRRLIRKEQYWRREPDGRWLIVCEENPAPQPSAQPARLRTALATSAE
ncbi:MAG: L,D-transpeptidase family protein [Sinobacteraceae bacterium]|nr:L,D-transpeptidase family protein [Nevskiaceae bacterium]